MSSVRVRYRERMTLGSDDLLDEQAYQIAMRRRHLIAGHRWGIVGGLALTPLAGGLRLAPGLAVDRYGRELIVAEAVTVASGELEAAFTPDSVPAQLDAWLTYARALEPAGAAGEPDRWREGCALLLTPAAQAGDPATAEPADTDYGPHLAPPDDPREQALVFLGRVGTGRADDATPALRQPIALVGEAVISPGGRAPASSAAGDWVAMQVGAERARDPRRFAVSLPDGAGRIADQLVIDRRGNLAANANVTAGQGLSARGCGFGPAPQPAQAAPWRIYRPAASAKGRRGGMLHIELPHPGQDGDPASYRLVLAGAGQTGPCLSVRADGTVIVHGDLQVKQGQLIEQGAGILSNPQVASAALAQWLQSGINTALSVSFAITGRAAGQPLGYAVQLRNRGSLSIADLAATITVLVEGAAHYLKEPLRLGAPALDAGKTMDLAELPPISLPAGLAAGAQISIVVTAIGIDASGHLAYGAAARIEPIGA